MILRSEMQYKKAFIVSIFSQIASSLTSLIAIYFMFSKFGNVDGFTFNDVLICYSISFFGFSTTECFFRGFDHFDEILSSGRFDIILTKPRNLLFQIIGEIIEIKKLGRALLALIVLAIVFAHNPILWSAEKVLAIVLMVLGTVIIYSGLFVVRAGICFYTTNSLEIMNIFTDGARDLTEYPLSIYHKAVKGFFTYVIPLALVNLYPLLYLIGKSDNKWYIFLPCLTIFFVIPCLLFWKIGLKKYKSVGS
jgi:ABC-2 type transport system permease protein